jgi:hypothetical protein
MLLIEGMCSSAEVSEWNLLAACLTCSGELFGPCVLEYSSAA